MGLEGQWCDTKNIKDGFYGSDAVCVLTEWQEYANIDWIEVANKMRQPAWVFDARSIVNVNKVVAAKLNLWRIGDGS